jgi:wyosine [tRNA(Phe)-imidazoG37] synthetase (radical SAM superfamily)
VYNTVENKLQQCSETHGGVDYMTFVPNGEPTLDQNLKCGIEVLKGLYPKVAVITNGSLIWRKETREALALADWVGIKVDTVHMGTWKRLNRPHRNLNLDRILGGILEFKNDYDHTLTTETMVVKGMNDDQHEFEAIAEFLTYIQPAICYIAVPDRPPADRRVQMPEATIIEIAETVFNQHGLNTEVLSDIQPCKWIWPPDLLEQLSALTAVHPVDEASINKILSKKAQGRDLIDKLVKDGKIRRLRYNGKNYYAAAMPVIRHNQGF